MKKKILILLLCLCIQLCLAACQHDTQANTGSESEKVTLTLATYGSTSLPAVSKFNASQNNYHIEIIDYSQDNTLSKEDALTRLNAELAAGKAPDMFYIWKLKMDADTYGTKGYLEDLYPFLDSDHELSRQDFVQSVLSTYECNEALYGTVSGFGIMTLFGSESILGTNTGWTFADLIELSDQYGSASDIFSSAYTKTEFLNVSMQVAIGEFVDFNSNTANFDTVYFREVLKFCNQFDNSIPENEKQDSQPILSLYCMNSFMELQYYESLFGDTVTFIGYPSSNGSGSYFVNMLDQYAMNKASQNKEGAWQFLRTFFTEEYQNSEYVDSSYTLFPSNLKSMNALIEKSMSSIMVEDDEGNLFEFTQRGDQDFEYHAATEDQIIQMMELINSTSAVSHYSAVIVDIVKDEASVYFAGDKSIDDVVKLIQSRVSMYLNEQD